MLTKPSKSSKNVFAQRMVSYRDTMFDSVPKHMLWILQMKPNVYEEDIIYLQTV